MNIGGTQPEHISKRLAELEGHFRERRDLMLGYQWSQKLDGYAELAPFLDYHLDNIGDPFSPSLTALNTKDFEREVLDYFAQLWHARGPSDLDDSESYWGYVLSMGSTEGNLYALWNARDYLSGSRLLSGGSGPEREPVLLYSADAHYSLAKGAAMLRIHTLRELGESRYPGQCPITPDGAWPIAVPSIGGSTGTGRIDTEQLAALVGFFADRGHPPIILLNLGSTFKGAYDHPEVVWEGIKDALGRNGMLGDRQGYWIHIDGALGAGCLIIAAAGNASNRPGSIQPAGAPANSPTIMSVAALDSSLRVASFSNGGKIDIAGPGVNTFSSWPRPQSRPLIGASPGAPGRP